MVMGHFNSHCGSYLLFCQIAIRFGSVDGRFGHIVDQLLLRGHF